MKVQIEYQPYFCGQDNVIVLQCREGEYRHAQAFPDGVEMTGQLLECFRKKAMEVIESKKSAEGYGGRRTMPLIEKRKELLGEVTGQNGRSKLVPVKWIDK